MKALEDKINQILEGIDTDQLDEEVEGWWETSTGAKFGANKLKELQECVAKEVKDIAIEFAEFIRFNATEIPDGWQVNGKGYNSEELFDQFIKQRYATP